MLLKGSNQLDSPSALCVRNAGGKGSDNCSLPYSASISKGFVVRRKKVKTHPHSLDMSLKGFQKQPIRLGLSRNHIEGYLLEIKSIINDYRVCLARTHASATEG